MTAAVVFAYHNVGVRCLRVLLAHGVDVRLVVTHADDARENIWFGSVAAVAAAYELPVIAPADPNAAGIVARVAAAKPDFLFSFYYRLMLKPALLAVPTRGALPERSVMGSRWAAAWDWRERRAGRGRSSSRMPARAGA